jgi:hypothetical protein
MFMRKTKQWMQLAIVIMICATTAITAKAQNGEPRLGVGVNVGSTLKSPARTTLGFDLRLQKSFGKGISGILTSGYYEFFKADDYNKGFGVIPLKAGLKYFPVKNIYIGGEAGAGFGTRKGAGTSFVSSTKILPAIMAMHSNWLCVLHTDLNCSS